MTAAIGYVTVTSMTFDKQSNGRRTAVESKSSRSCNQRISLVGAIAGRFDLSAASVPHSVTQSADPTARSGRRSKFNFPRVKLTRTACSVERPSSHVHAKRDPTPNNCAASICRFRSQNRSRRWLQHYDLTWIRRPFDCLSKVTKVTVT